MKMAASLNDTGRYKYETLHLLQGNKSFVSL